MKINSLLKKEVQKNVLSFSTTGKGSAPHIIFVACVKVVDGKILITDNYMKKTVKNIKRNKRVALAFMFKGKGIELLGVANYFSKGKWVDLVKAMPENKGLSAKGAIVVSVSKIKKMA